MARLVVVAACTYGCFAWSVCLLAERASDRRVGQENGTKEGERFGAPAATTAHAPRLINRQGPQLQAVRSAVRASCLAVAKWTSFVGRGKVASRPGSRRSPHGQQGV